MKQRFTIGLLAAAMSIGGTLAHAAVILPSATLKVNDTLFELALTPDPAKSDRFFFDETVAVTDVFEIFARGTMDADPLASYGLTVSNFGTVPLSVILTVVMPFAPLSASTITSGITGTLTPGPLDLLGLTMSPLLADADGDGIAELMTSTDGVSSLGVDLGPGVTIPSPLAAVYGPFTGGPVAGPAGLSALVLSVGLSLTGGGDVADLTGSTIVSAVPEPATIAILGLGVLATVARRARGRASR
jgi:PEP-CTERM motif